MCSINVSLPALDCFEHEKLLRILEEFEVGVPADSSKDMPEPSLLIQRSK